MIRLFPSDRPLDLPDLAADTPVGDDPDPLLADLVHAEPARDRGWWLGGRRAHAEFHGLHGLVDARFGSGVRVGGLGWGSGAPAATWITPRAARFERTCPAGSFLETIRVPERLPGLLVEVRPVGTWLPGRSIDGLLHVRPGWGDVAPDGPGEAAHDFAVAGSASARWFGGSETEGLLVAAFDAEGPAEVMADPVAHDDSVSLALSWTPGHAEAVLTLALLAGEPSAASLRSLLAARAHDRRAAPAKEALRTRVGVDEVDDGIAWAWTRVRDRALDAAGPIPELDPTDAASWVRTALAAGLPDAARAVLAEDPRTVDEVAAWEAWAAGVGSGGPLDDLARRVGAAVDRPADVRAALGRVADRARDDAWAAELGGTSDIDTDASRVDGPIDRATPEQWRLRIADDPAALGVDGWRILDDLIGGVLAWRPDAATGRMHLTPDLPSHWTRFVVEGLRGGELRMRLECSREESMERGTDETWRFAPMAGAVPATLILRLPLPDPAATVTVDGVPADLDVEPGDGPGDPVRAPIQLQLDRERVVRVTAAPGGGEKRRTGMVLPTLSPRSG